MGSAAIPAARFSPSCAHAVPEEDDAYPAVLLYQSKYSGTISLAIGYVHHPVPSALNRQLIILP